MHVNNVKISINRAQMLTKLKHLSVGDFVIAMAPDITKEVRNIFVGDDTATAEVYMKYVSCGADDHLFLNLSNGDRYRAKELSEFENTYFVDVAGVFMDAEFISHPRVFKADPEISLMVRYMPTEKPLMKFSDISSNRWFLTEDSNIGVKLDDYNYYSFMGKDIHLIDCGDLMVAPLEVDIIVNR